MTGRTLDDHLDQLRSTYRRLDPHETAAAVADGALLVDIRPVTQRVVEGEVPGAIVIDRNVLEWRLAPSSDHRIAEAGDPGRAVVLMCSEGYASSLAAVSLQAVGLPFATDLAGGFVAWRDAGLPTRDALAPGRPAPDPSAVPGVHSTA